jgi:phage terminase small subunit
MTTEKPKKPAIKTKLSRSEIREGLKQIPIEQILTGSGKKSTLTHKQREFARNVALGETKAQSYRNAYKSKGNPATVGNKGSTLSKRDDIQAEIEAFRLANEAMEYLKADRLKALVIHQLTQHALNDDIPPASRIRSLELLGKSAEVGLFVERKEITTINNSKDAKTVLMDKLREAMKRNAIDTDYSDAQSLLDEIKTPSPIENGESATHYTPTPQNEPADRGPDMHNIPHTQNPQIEQVLDSKDISPVVATLPDDTNHFNNDAQVVDFKGDTPSNISQVDWVESVENTPPMKNSEN